jgi:hypothetical protein
VKVVDAEDRDSLLDKLDDLVEGKLDALLQDLFHVALPHLLVLLLMGS